MKDEHGTSGYAKTVAKTEIAEVKHPDLEFELRKILRDSEVVAKKIQERNPVGAGGVDVAMNHIRDSVFMLHSCLNKV